MCGTRDRQPLDPSNAGGLITEAVERRSVGGQIVIVMMSSNAWHHDLDSGPRGVRLTISRDG